MSRFDIPAQATNEPPPPSVSSRSCDCGHPAGRVFRFASGAAPTEKCLRHSVTHRPLLRNSILTALVVGTILTAINQGNVILGGAFPPALWWKIPLTYSVPYMVSTWAALRISLVRGRP